MEQQFRTRGFILLRPDWLVSGLGDIQQIFKETINNFPDFTPNQGVWGVRQDGILTNPGSFHNPLSRRLRQCATREIAPIIVDLLTTHPTFGMQCVLAPISYSPAAWNSKDGARWWYKRSAFEPGEVVLKGYANIGSSTQVFTCAPGTHISSLSPNSKPIEVFRQFHPSAKDMSKATDCGNRLDCDGHTVKIRVPPGTLVVYHTTLLVKLETSRAVNECTQHFRWVFGARNTSLEAITGLKQPSKWPSYYPGDFRHTKRNNALYRLQAFSRGFRDRWLTREPYGNVIPASTMAQIGPRVPPVIEQSLRELGNQYPDYGPEEQLLYSMSRGPWSLGDGDLCPVTVLDISDARDLTANYQQPNSYYGEPAVRYREPYKEPDVRYREPYKEPNVRYREPNYRESSARRDVSPPTKSLDNLLSDWNPSSADEAKKSEKSARILSRTRSLPTIPPPNPPTEEFEFETVPDSPPAAPTKRSIVARKPRKR